MTINTSAIKTPEAAIKAQATARRKRAYAAQQEAKDPIVARWERLEAAELDTKAAHVLDPCNSVTAPLAVGRGGELIVDLAEESALADRPLIDTTRDSPDMITAQASLTRIGLAMDANVLALTVDLADTMQAGNSLERMLAGQLAALHAMVMKNAATAASFAIKASDPHGAIPTAQRQIANVEAARSANAAARASEAFQHGMLTLDRLRNGGRQTVVVQHVNVRDGGQAVVAGAVQDGGLGD
jgi:hypothetical protein